MGQHTAGWQFVVKFGLFMDCEERSYMESFTQKGELTCLCSMLNWVVVSAHEIVDQALQAIQPIQSA